MRWSFGCWLLTSLYVATWTCWRLFDLKDCDSQRGRWCGSLQGCYALFRQSTVTNTMSTLGIVHRFGHIERRPMRCGFPMMTTGRFRRICAPSAWWVWTHLVYGLSTIKSRFHDVLIDNLAVSPSWRSPDFRLDLHLATKTI